MNNAEWMIKQGYHFTDLDVRIKGEVEFGTPSHKAKEFYVRLNGKKIDSLESYDDRHSVLKMWLDMEHKEPILDETERRYLSAVIRPFRNDVKSICKERGIAREHIAFYGKSYFFLPDFDAGTMYKGMEPKRWYKLEELGL